MSDYDLIVRNSELVLGSEVTRGDIAVREGTIAAVGDDIGGSSAREIDATGLHVFAGGIDAHVHFNEPGRTSWEGIATGSQALAAGGMTLYFDMPLNAHPPTTDGPSFDQKIAAAEASSRVDFALWGGLVPGNLDQLAELAARGVVGFKAFMANSGIDDFPAVDDLTLYEGMARSAELGCMVAVHAENDLITRKLTERALAAGRTGARDYLASRPIIAELEAISRAILFAEQTGCRLHIVHISTTGGAALVVAAQARGVDVTGETCPQYLVLNEDDIDRCGVLAKCSPPLRSQRECDGLWDAIREGRLGIVTSDHSPASPDVKTGAHFFAAWGGISGCQSTRQLLLAEGYAARGLPLTTIAAATSTNVARRFSIEGKGSIEAGYDADLALVDLTEQHTLRAEDLLYRHKYSPYVGRTLRGRVVASLLRGEAVFEQGAIVAGPPRGRLVTPHREI